MTTPEFIAWLDGKMAEHGDGKLIPPADVLAAELEKQLEAKVCADVTERVLREARIDDQIAAALAAMPDVTALKTGIEALFGDEPEAEWRDHVEAVVGEISK